MIPAFPKIFAVGSDFISRIFTGEVEVTEKIDGSQFGFGVVADGELFVRSKGARIWPETPQKMFKQATDYVSELFEQGKLEEGIFYYGECVDSPKHNVLKYERTPKHNIMIFGVCDNGHFISEYDKLKEYADVLDLETVPLLFKGKIENPTMLLDLLKTPSVLGKVETKNGEVSIEGVVVKNYNEPFLLGGQPIAIMMGKYVSEQFKEVHRENWNAENTVRGKFDVFKESFRTEARWEKAIQHLRERNELENEPRDIGKILAEIKEDILEEESENIKTFLFNEFKGEVLRVATRGVPEWYKQKLIENSFEGVESETAGSIAS
jgi:hypothetical protein